MPRATLMRSSRSRAKRPRLCQEWRPKSRSDFWRRTAQKEAWKAINAIDENRPGWIPFEWEEVRLDVMEELGHKDEAQTFRWQCFERTLNGAHLRAYLKRMPDFDDIEGEERAMSYALRFLNVHQALQISVSLARAYIKPQRL